jgi:starch synthase
VRVLLVASEAYPLVKTGGLADVVGALPSALTQTGVDARLLLPGYPSILQHLRGIRRLSGYADLFGGEAHLLSGKMQNDIDVMAIFAPHLYERSGNIYLGPDRRDWPDNHRRFAALAWVAAHLTEGNIGWRPDVLHAHDWQAGLVPVYAMLAAAQRPATLMTVHNLAFQGLFPAGLLGELRLPTELFNHRGVEFHDQIGFLKAGLVYADRITTVSPTYAREIRTTEQGYGLDGLLTWRADDLSGILNGIDTQVWDPEHDPALPSPYGKDSLGAKAANKSALQDQLGLENSPDRILFGVISRLTYQKGVDLLLPVLPRLVGMGGQLVLLGAGDSELESAFVDAARGHPGHVAVRIGFDEHLAHLIQGAADAILMPSRFEPCGLTQLCALRYGTLPIVSRVGGLADSVIDANAAALADGVATGIQFAPPTTEALADALERAFALYRQPQAWRSILRRVMGREVGWQAAAHEYKSLYTSLLAARP